MPVMVTTVFCHLLLVACSMAFVLVSKKLVDLAVARDMGPIWTWVAVLCGVILARILLRLVKNFIQTKAEVSMRNGIRSRMFDVLLRLQFDGGRKLHSGDLMNRVQADVRALSTAFTLSFPNLVGAFFHFAAALTLFIIIDSRLAVIVAVIIPFGIFGGKYVTEKIKSLTMDIRKTDSRVQSYLQESIQHVSLLQTMEYEQDSSDNLTSLQGKLYKDEIRRTRFSLLSRMLISLAFSSGHAVAFVWGVFGIASGTVTYGMMTAFLQLVGQVQRPLMDIGNNVSSIIHCLASVDRLMEIEDLPREEVSASVKIWGKLGLKVEDVTFAYADSDEAVFSGFSYDFAPGSKTAVVGPTGVGKSTLIRLLLALLKPSGGHINIYSSDGSVVEVSAATRANLVYVPQGNSLFSGTIRENLLMGNPDADVKEMEDALRCASADFVLELPDGLDTPCFEGGVRLSEGQAQRIAIARALLRPGTILLLDEFSSALDSETEQQLMSRLTESLADRTMIFITHRDCILEYCDAVLDLGKI